VVQIDLDLDVVRRVDGSVEIIDEDEFANHQVLHDYPQGLIDGAREAADLVLLALQERREPFTEAAERWLTVARPEHEIDTERPAPRR
jgi:protein associated with RNAse G/E